MEYENHRRRQRGILLLVSTGVSVISLILFPVNESVLYFIVPIMNFFFHSFDINTRTRGDQDMRKGLTHLLRHQFGPSF